MIKGLVSFLAIGLLLSVMPGYVFAQTATLSLDPSTGTYNLGCSFALNVIVNTGGAQTDGVDAILFYDVSRLTANSITNGTIFSDYPGDNIDSTAGKITISGLASVDTPFVGQGTLATINFTVNPTAATGATQVTFDFDPNNKSSTTHSNVVERNTIAQLLNSVVNGNYTIGSGVCGTNGSTQSQGSTGTTFQQVGGPPSSSASATISPTYTTKLPSAGSEQLTFTVAIIGGVLTVLGILGLAFL